MLKYLIFCYLLFHFSICSILPVNLFNLIVIPGADIENNINVNISLEYLPGFSAESRSSAGAVVRNLTNTIYSSELFILMSGGYNVGVRYLLNGTILQQPNNSFQAYANARNYASEAETMKNFIALKFAVPTNIIMVEEDSDSTAENSKFSSILLQRLSTYTFPNEKLQIGLLTNLYHMPKFIGLVIDDNLNPLNVSFYPLFAEDYVCMLLNDMNGNDWIETISTFYVEYFTTWNVTKIESIMLARRSGNYSVSVGSLCTECYKKL